MVEPMYRRIAQELRQQIKSGMPGPGEQLPTEIELRDRYDASRNTVRDAIKLLTTLGLVETRPGNRTRRRRGRSRVHRGHRAWPETFVVGTQGRSTGSDR
jgi:DNA-binding FadR family transcriptional regulator